VEEFGIEGIHRLSPEPGDTISTSPLREKKGGDKSTEGKKNRNGCGVICTLAGYYTKPSVPELDLYMDNDGKCLIREFRVGRQNFGQVKFLEVVNVAGLNIDEIGKKNFCWCIIIIYQILNEKEAITMSFCSIT